MLTPNMVVQYPQNGRTVGIEIEVENISTKGVLDNTLSPFFGTHTDASCESDAILLSELNIPVVHFPKNIRLNSSRGIPGGNKIGGEFVTKILDSFFQDELLELFARFFYRIQSCGEILGNRAGIHFHVSFSNPTYYSLVNLVTVCGFLESTFFVLGGMNRVFRGEKNDAAYCRPITSPPYIPSARKRNTFIPVFSLEDLKSSTSGDDFWYKYGDLPHSMGQRFHPIRYCWLNILPVFDGRRAAEVRIYNTTLSPKNLIANLYFWREVVQYALKNDNKIIELEINSVFKGNSKIANDSFDRFVGMTGFHIKYPELTRVLQNQLEITPYPKMRKGEFKSHLLVLNREVLRQWGGGEYSPPEVSSRNILEPNFTDLHRLRGEI